MPNDFEGLQNAVNEMADLVGKNNKDFLDHAKIANIEAALNKQEKANQALTLELKEQAGKKLDIEEKAKAFEERIYSLEKAGVRPVVGSVDKAKAKVRLEQKAFNEFLVSGENKMSPEEVKYLRTDVGEDGGYLVTEENFGEIIKNVTEISPIRSIARVRTVGRARGLEINKRATLVSSFYVGEGQTSTPSNSKYGLETIKLEKVITDVAITLEELSDSYVNIENEMGMDVAESIAKLEGGKFVNGGGAAFGVPEGFMTNADISVVNSGAATAITAESLNTLMGELKTSYAPNAIFGFNRRTMALIKNIRTSSGASATTGDFMWQIGNLAAGIPNTLNGVPYIEIPDMDDVAANSHPIIFGDFGRGYVIADRAGVNVTRDDVTLIRDGKIGFVYISRNGGGVVQPEAFVKLKISA